MVNKNYADMIDAPEAIQVKYSIANHSLKNYMVVIDPSNLYVYSNIEWLDRWSRINNDASDRQLFQMGITMGNSGKYKNTGYNIIHDYFENLPSLAYAVNENIIFIKAGETMMRSLDFTYPIIINTTENNGSVQFFLLDDPEFFNIFLFQDRKLILKNVNEKNRRKMNSMNAEVYTGVLESNRIPVRFRDH